VPYPVVPWFIAELIWPIKERGGGTPMTAFLIGLIPSFIFLAALGVSLGLYYWVRSTRSHHRCPLTRDLLRGPGHSLVKRIEELNADINCSVLSIAVVPLVLYSSYLSRFYFGVVKQGEHTVIICGLVWIGATLFLSVKLRRSLKERHNHRLGLDCEMAVGQELNNLMGEGYRVYHDIPAEGFNIDHVVVGRNGIFAVETKGRSKSNRGRGSGDATVVYDGRVLKFPDWISTEFLNQARRQAEWLSGWLSEMVGELVPVQPVLVIPGWYVERIRRGDVLVLNGKNDYKFIASQWTKAILSRKLIESVSDVLEQVCRDVAPMAYTASEKREDESPQSRSRKVLGRVLPIRRIGRGSS
jgi:hypothetical protein